MSSYADFLFMARAATPFIAKATRCSGVSLAKTSLFSLLILALSSSVHILGVAVTRALAREIRALARHCSVAVMALHLAVNFSRCSLLKDLFLPLVASPIFLRVSSDGFLSPSPPLVPFVKEAPTNFIYCIQNISASSHWSSRTSSITNTSGFNPEASNPFIQLFLYVTGLNWLSHRCAYFRLVGFLDLPTYRIWPVRGSIRPYINTLDATSYYGGATA